MKWLTAMTRSASRRPCRLDCEDAGVHAPAAAVELQRVDVKDEGAPAFAPGVKGRGDGEPLVGVYDIEGDPTGD